MDEGDGERNNYSIFFENWTYQSLFKAVSWLLHIECLETDLMRSSIFCQKKKERKKNASEDSVFDML